MVGKLNKYFILYVQASFQIGSLCEGEHIGLLKVAYWYLEFELHGIFITLRKIFFQGNPVIN